MVKNKGMFPFKTLKDQKVFSIIILIAGLLVMFVTAPFVIKIEAIALVSGIIGLVLFFIGLFYFLDAFVN